MKKTFLIFTLVLCISLIVSAQEKNKFLYNAILNNDLDKVVKLLNDSADANYIVTKPPDLKISVLIAAVNKKSVNMVKTLLEHKADVNWRDGFDTPAIIYAASTGSKVMVELLLNYGADINAKDEEGNSVLGAAKESKNVALINYIKDKQK